MPTGLSIDCVSDTIGLKCTLSSNVCATPVQVVPYRTQRAAHHQNWFIISPSKLLFECSSLTATTLANTLASKAARHTLSQRVE
jgi:hypothetical protein